MEETRGRGGREGKGREERGQEVSQREKKKMRERASCRDLEGGRLVTGPEAVETHPTHVGSRQKALETCCAPPKRC